MIIKTNTPTTTSTANRAAWKANLNIKSSKPRAEKRAAAALPIPGSNDPSACPIAAPIAFDPILLIILEPILPSPIFKVLPKFLIELNIWRLIFNVLTLRKLSILPSNELVGIGLKIPNGFKDGKENLEGILEIIGCWIGFAD